MTEDEKFMTLAIQKAREAYARGDYAIGAVIVENGKVVANGGNRVKTKRDSTKHVELEIIQYVVGTKLGTESGTYLEDCTLYSTHEPCPMCACAAHWAKVKRIVFGVTINDIHLYTDEKAYYKWRVVPIKCKETFKGQIKGGVLKQECLKLLRLPKIKHV